MTNPAPPLIPDYARRILIFLLIAILVPLFTQKGLVGCAAWPSLETLHPIPKSFAEMIFSVPVCNGWLAYGYSTVAAILLFGRTGPLVLTVIGCTLTEIGYRATFLGETQWALLLPAWKFTSSLILLTPVLLIYFLRKK